MVAQHNLRWDQNPGYTWVCLGMLGYCLGTARVLLKYCLGMLGYYFDIALVSLGYARVLLRYCLSIAWVLLEYFLGMLGYCPGINLTFFYYRLPGGLTITVERPCISNTRTWTTAHARTCTFTSPQMNKYVCIARSNLGFAKHMHKHIHARTQTCAHCREWGEDWSFLRLEEFVIYSYIDNPPPSPSSSFSFSLVGISRSGH